MDGAQPLLSVVGVEKTYPNGTAALRGVSFAVAGGCIHGLVGANGAGKSTLIKILAGAIPPSAGTIVWDGEPRSWRAPAEAQAAGIVTIHQNIPLAGTLSVIENVFLATRRPWRAAAAERQRFAELLDTVGYEIDPDTPVAELSIGRRQMVSILQALAADARLIVMDEPTASLSDNERGVVYQTVRRLRAQGRSVLFISHFLDEILALCEEITVIRDGRVVLDDRRDAVDESRLVAAIVGRKTDLYVPRRPGQTTADAAPLLEVRDLASPRGVAGVSLAVRPGEVVGLAGLLGSGRSEILHAIYGADPQATGTVAVAGRKVPRSIGGAIEAGILLVPEDRNREALFLDESIRWNASLPNSAAVCAGGLLPVFEREAARASHIMAELSVVARDAEVEVGQLSGGNAQKVALGRTLATDAAVLLLDEPTVGIDIGAKADIRGAIDRLAAAGKAVIVVISNFEELLGMCRRVLVVAAGRIIAERLASETSEHELVALAGGLAPQQPA
jgi:ribose transport system ATP-binding protein